MVVFLEKIWACLYGLATAILYSQGETAMAGTQPGRSPRNNAEENNLYSVGDVCGMVGTTRKTLFYYDKIGLLVPTRREGVQNTKQYDSGKVCRLRKILEYRDADLGIAEIRKLLDDEETDHLEIMQSALVRMRKKKKNMENAISNLEKLIREELNRANTGPG